MTKAISRSIDEALAEVRPDALALKPWFIAQTRRGAERYSEDALRERGFDAYLPREIRPGVKRPTQEKVGLKYPLLPGYMFVSVDYPRQLFDTVRDLCGVQFLRRAGADRPMSTAPGYVERMRLAEALGLFDRTRSDEIQLAVGDRVKIVGGIFVNHFAQIVRAKGEGARIRVMFDFLGGAHEIELKPEQIEVAA